ncbi:MAG: SDR family NAD(P)-dependent oxidoreductase, partial [Alloalcanivorax xenomutans]
MPQQHLSHGARAVVTGAGSGIGRAFALALAKRGGRVVCADLNMAAAEDTVSIIERAGGHGLAVSCDVSELAAVERLAAEAVDWFGESPNLVINNAGVGAGGKADRRRQVPVRPRRADAIAAAMQVQDLPVGGRAGHCQVFARHPAEPVGPRRDPGGQLKRL